MTKNRQLQRLAIALLASILWNCVLIATPFFTIRFPSSRIGRVMDALGRPGGLSPSGFYRDTMHPK